MRVARTAVIRVGAGVDLAAFLEATVAVAVPGGARVRARSEIARRRAALSAGAGTDVPAGAAVLGVVLELDTRERAARQSGVAQALPVEADLVGRARRAAGAAVLGIVGDGDLAAVAA